MKTKTLMVFILFYSSQIFSQNSDWNILQPSNIGVFKNIQVKNEMNMYLLTDLGLYKSVDKGYNWIELIRGDIETFSLYNDNEIIISKNYDQGNCSILLLKEDVNTLIKENEHFISKENNSSVVISKYFINKGDIYAVADYRFEPFMSKYGNLFSNILFKTNGDTLWQKINYPGYYIYSLSIKNKDTLIVANNGSTSSNKTMGWTQRIEYSYNNGAIWSVYGGVYLNSNTNLTTISSLIISQSDAIIYGQYNLHSYDATRGLFRLDDFMDTNHNGKWDNYLIGIPIIKLFSHSSSSNLYALTPDSLFVSKTDGKSWYNRNNSQIFSNNLDFTVDKDGIVYVISSNKIYKSKNDLTIVEKDNIHLSNEYILLQNYPNPFNPQTTIEYSIAKAGNVKILLYDMLGKELRVLADEFKNVGHHKIVFDGSNYSSGIYFYKIQTSNYSQTKKLSLIK
ncbi:MAG: hypothetical protein A2499_17080 [Stygiobacter sp. RIFOXYC12_FULL_38_8]|nr:MAG: hypothetical protein A2X62_03775 [Stygiobacter sp. GWC2_38_9]OGV15186.1 MAG: hypothetical protein A2440_19485 [Stygiobacter sp. RIFOXYC2_FULL_38_25]OGV17119.1 MAG: hypothetical protein A2237_05280 [Stygiobacter sp. RIFOXYA2_FULL_38_8]OGV24547.1 MAG: hypothetical protein A2499_17080 [Stygiobacter sp. RIFOXYC12_FULL_38_8]OGV79770.1 MAG: hypothetical protein A2X65_10325 [Stygiobacter sp. GWF2_38_21]